MVNFEKQNYHQMLTPPTKSTTSGRKMNYILPFQTFNDAPSPLNWYGVLLITSSNVIFLFFQFLQHFSYKQIYLHFYLCRQVGMGVSMVMVLFALLPFFCQVTRTVTFLLSYLFASCNSKLYNTLQADEITLNPQVQNPSNPSVQR